MNKCWKFVFYLLHGINNSVREELKVEDQWLEIFVKNESWCILAIWKEVRASFMGKIIWEA